MNWTAEACKLGLVCDDNGDSTNCTVLRERVIEAGYGDILAGSFCPGEVPNCTLLHESAIEAGYGDIFVESFCSGEVPFLGVSKLLNCPVGYYCPDPETIIVCPKGYFCPHKSSTYYIECPRCEEGARKLERHWAGFSILMAMILVCAFYFVLARSLRQRLRRRNELAYAKKNDTRILDQDQIHKEEEEIRSMQIERIKPKLLILSSRMNRRNKNESSSLLYDNEKELVNAVDFLSAPDELFDKLDEDGNEELSYSELNSLLHLNQAQLRAFVATMNEAGDVPDSTPLVSKEVFCNHFLDVLEKATCVSPTTEDARILFREIAAQFGTNSKGELSYKKLYDSSLSNFLSDFQIYEIIKYFKKHVMVLPDEGRRKSLSLSRIGGSFVSERPSMIRREKTVQAPLSLRLSFRAPAAGTDQGIKINDFVEYYPRALRRVLVDHVSSENQEDTGEPLSKRIGLDITFKDLSLTVKNGAREVKVVDQCWGRCESNTMTAIMGSSGSGKTSLLNALCGRAAYGEVAGDTWINGHLASIENYQGVIGFVPQDDIIYSDLTVRENFIFGGQLRLPRGTSFDEIYELAEQTISSLGLIRVADSIVGDHRKRGLSGGEKKRVNIGLELMAKPLACFLDEPTSGLDSYSALLVMSSLRHLVDCQGVTMVSVIHQPRKGIFDLFDSLALLGVGGKMMYFGKACDAEKYFRSQDFAMDSGEGLADWLIDVSSGSIKPLKFKALDQPTMGLGPTSLARSKTSVSYELALAAKKVGPSTGVSAEENIKISKLRRENLVAAWREHCLSLSESDSEHDHAPPSNMQLPSRHQRPTNSVQFRVQVTRIFLLWRRNAGQKVADALLVVLVGTVMAIFNGVTESTINNIPNVPYEVLASEDPEKLEMYFPALFAYATLATEFITQYGLMMTVVLSILEGVSNVKTMTQNRDSFFREASSGVAANPYFLAINVSMVIESVCHMVLAAVGVHWARQSIASIGNYISHFIIMGWLVSAWALVIPILVPPESVTIVMVCFLAFFSVVFSGASATMGYPEFYGQFVEIIGGLFSVNRYAVEGIIVAEQRCLMPQSGFTIAPDAGTFPDDKDSFNLLSLAQHDIDTVVEQSCGGWYWGVWRGLLVGFTIRVIAGGLIHVVNRGKQGKKPIRKSLRKRPTMIIVSVCFAVACITLLSLTTLFILT